MSDWCWKRKNPIHLFVWSKHEDTFSPGRGVNVMADNCLGDLVVMTLTRECERPVFDSSLRHWICQSIRTHCYTKNCFQSPIGGNWKKIFHFQSPSGGGGGGGVTALGPFWKCFTGRDAAFRFAFAQCKPTLRSILVFFFHVRRFLSDYLTDLRLHRTK